MTNKPIVEMISSSLEHQWAVEEQLLSEFQTSRQGLGNMAGSMSLRMVYVIEEAWCVFF